MRKLKLMTICISCLLAFALILTGCGKKDDAKTDATQKADAPAKTDAAAPDKTDAPAPSGDKTANPDAIVLKIGFENSITEPVGQGLVKWQELVDQKGDGSIKIELYPDSQLGSKNELIDSMLLGEPVITLADGAFYADYGVPDFGIMMAPFLYNSWDDCWTLIDSDWYKEQEAALEGKGLKLLGSKWIYGDRHTLTTKPVHTVDDLKELKIRVPGNKIQSIGFDVLGATSTGMALGDVYPALQAKTIDGAENPLATLYGRKLQEVAKYLILDGHVKNFCTWVASADLFNTFTADQQKLLLDTCAEAGLFNNDLQQKEEAKYLQLMKDAGVEVYEPTEADLNTFREKAKDFYNHADDFKWSDGLYDRVLEALGRK